MNDFEGSTECAKKAANVLSAQAKVERDSLILSKIYAIMSYRTDTEYSLRYADSLIMLSKEPEDFYFFDKYLIKGYVYYFLEQPLMASKEFTKTYEQGIEYKNFETEVRAQIWLATIKEENEESSQALELYFETLASIDKWETEDNETKRELKLSVLQSIIILELNNKDPDKADFYLKEAKNILAEYPSQNATQKTRIWDGKIAFLREDYDTAYDILKAELGINHGSEDLDLLFTLGTIQKKKNNAFLERKHFRQFDSISTKLKLSPIPESKSVYLFLLNDAITQNDNKKQLEYYDKLIYIDSFLTANKKDSDLIEMPGYSISDLKNQRDTLINKSKGKDYALLIFGSCLVVFIIVLIFYVKKYNRAKQSLSDYIDSSPSPKEVINTESVDKVINEPKDSIQHVKKKIDKEIEASVKIALYKLNSWEEAKGFTNKDVDLNYLANLFKTNRTYISKAVNVYKDKKFRVYITELRMNHFIQTTRKNYDYRNKNLSSILEEFGFNSIDTFSRALKTKLKNKNITPSMYMNEIIKRNT
ncbi:hypothetical protein [uncultured Maribacter sp.]|uniref:helix-turn-helix domain-containing protein n=1 Tax=uncultured Maribacter sp. TaxID=431308 RepID=UPI0030EBC935